MMHKSEIMGEIWPQCIQRAVLVVKGANLAVVKEHPELRSIRIECTLLAPLQLQLQLSIRKATSRIWTMAVASMDSPNST